MIRPPQPPSTHTLIHARALSHKDGKMADYLDALRAGRRISYWWSTEEGWLDGRVSKAPAKVVTKNTIRWKIGVVFDNGDGHALDFHPREGRWRVLPLPDDDDEDDGEVGGGPSSSSAPPPPPLATGEDGGSHSPRRVASDLIDATCHEIVLLGMSSGPSENGDVADVPTYASYAFLARRLDHYMDALDRCDIEVKEVGRGGALLDEKSDAWRRLLMAKLVIDVCSRRTYPSLPPHVDTRPGDRRPALIDLPAQWWRDLRCELERLRDGVLLRRSGGDRPYECLICQMEALEALAELRGRLRDAEAASLEVDDGVGNEQEDPEILVERFVEEYLTASDAVDGRLRKIGMIHYVDLFVPRQTLAVFVGGGTGGGPVASLTDGIDGMIVRRVFPLHNLQVEVLRLLRGWEGAHLARPALFVAGYFVTTPTKEDEDADGGRGRKGQSLTTGGARGSAHKQPTRKIQGARRPPVLALDSDGSASDDNSMTVKRTRKKNVPYTNEEKRMLLEGVEKLGVGNWAEILAHYDFNDRTSGNLKDLYRTLTKAKKADSSWGSPRRIT